MEIKDLTAILVVAMVGCILVAGFIPVVGESVTATTTFDNRDGALFEVEKITADSTYSFEWVYTDPTHATVNGDIISLKNATVICSTNSFLIRYGQDGPSGYYLQSVGGGLAIYGSETNKTTLTITANAGTITAVVANEGSSPTTKTIDFVEGYGIVANGSYVMKSPTQNAYMLSDSPIVAMGLTSLDGVWSNMFQITGTIENVDVIQVYPNPATYTISNVAVNSNAVNGYNDLSKLSSITFTATQIEDTSKVHNCTYNFFIVPAEVTAEKTIHADDNTASIIAMIPFILIMGIVLMFVGVVLVRRYV